MRPPRVGAYPGSFDPPTIAHLAVAEAAVAEAHLDRLDLIVSRRPLGKAATSIPTLDDRVAVLEAVAGSRPWLGVQVSSARLVVDVVEGYDVVVMGADKWSQVIDPTWYGGSVDARDAALARLPEVFVAPRGGKHPAAVTLLGVAHELHHVSSSLARAGAVDLMLPEAAAFDARTGAWTDPTRYRPGA